MVDVSAYKGKLLFCIIARAYYQYLINGDSHRSDLFMISDISGPFSLSQFPIFNFAIFNVFNIYKEKKNKFIYLFICLELERQYTCTFNIYFSYIFNLHRYQLSVRYERSGGGGALRWQEELCGDAPGKKKVRTYITYE